MRRGDVVPGGRLCVRGLGRVLSARFGFFGRACGGLGVFVSYRGAVSSSKEEGGKSVKLK